MIAAIFEALAFVVNAFEFLILLPMCIIAGAVWCLCMCGAVGHYIYTLIERKFHA